MTPASTARFYRETKDDKSHDMVEIFNPDGKTSWVGTVEDMTPEMKAQHSRDYSRFKAEAAREPQLLGVRPPNTPYPGGQTGIQGQQGSGQDWANKDGTPQPGTERGAQQHPGRPGIKEINPNTETDRDRHAREERTGVPASGNVPGDAPNPSNPAEARNPNLKK